MQITVDLTEEQSQQLLALAESLSVNPQDLARAAVISLLTHPADDFDRAATYVLDKNNELYKRLS